MFVVDKRNPPLHNNDDCNDKKVYFRNCGMVGMIDQGDEKLPPSVYGSFLLILRLHDSTSTVFSNKPCLRSFAPTLSYTL